MMWEVMKYIQDFILLSHIAIHISIIIFIVKNVLCAGNERGKRCRVRGV